MRILEIELHTTNLQETERFYKDVLQLPLVHQSADKLSFAAGYSMIHFTKTTHLNGAYHFAFLIPRNQLQDAYNWIKSRTAILPFSEAGDIADFTNWNAQAFYFHDEAQNILEFIVHHDLENENNQPYAPQTIIGIGEMGVAVADVPEACQAMHTQAGVPFYTKGPHLQNFAAMGEEDGLLIVSTEGRGWLPTGQPAAKNKVQVVLEIDDNNTKLEF